MSEQTVAEAPEIKPRYKHCCDTFDTAPQVRQVRNEGGIITERWVHYQPECMGQAEFDELDPHVQAAVNTGAIDDALGAEISKAIPLANAADEESAIHAAMPLDATESYE